MGHLVFGDSAHTHSPQETALQFGLLEGLEDMRGPGSVCVGSTYKSFRYISVRNNKGSVAFSSPHLLAPHMDLLCSTVPSRA